MRFPFWKYPVHTLAHGFGTGLSPVAPGTVGSVVGVVLFWLMAPLTPALYAAIVVVMFFAGIFICGQTASDMDAVDPGSIVYDEIVGFLVAMFMIPADWRWILAGFLIYRLFDIWKPFPIHAAEQRLGLGGGIMTDDVIAGLYTLAILHLAKFLLDRVSAGTM